MTFQEKLTGILNESQILVNEPMSSHTTFRVGGAAEYYLKPDAEQLPKVIALCKEERMPYFVIGNGSNLLVGDRGIDGTIIEVGPAMAKITVEGNILYAQAGTTLARIAQEAAKNSLTGLEFAAGIPGTVGGAVYMNAGAYGGEIKDILLWAEILDAAGNVAKLTAEELELSYRHSKLMAEEGIVLSAAFELTQGEESQIRSRMEELRVQRVTKQPLEYPSAGSTFKRPEGYFAGKLIQDAGLRGYRVNDAQVAEKHCGFVINRGNATAADIVKLMGDVTKKVQEDFGVTLEPEVKMIGKF